MSDPFASVAAGGKDHAQTAAARSDRDGALKDALWLDRAAGAEVSRSGIRHQQGPSRCPQAALGHPAGPSRTRLDAPTRQVIPAPSLLRSFNPEVTRNGIHR